MPAAHLLISSIWGTAMAVGPENTEASSFKTTLSWKTLHLVPAQRKKRSKYVVPARITPFVASTSIARSDKTSKTLSCILSRSPRSSLSFDGRTSFLAAPVSGFATLPQLSSTESAEPSLEAGDWRDFDGGATRSAKNDEDEVPSPPSLPGEAGRVSAAFSASPEPGALIVPASEASPLANAEAGSKSGSAVPSQ